MDFSEADNCARANGSAGKARIFPVELRCEWRLGPLEIDAPRPRLSWRLEAVNRETRGLRALAYRVLVASSAERLVKEEGDLWDSGRMETGGLPQVVFAGAELVSRQDCFWKVRVWDQDGAESDWSEAAHWKTGLLAPADWTADWIGAELPPATRQIDAVTRARLLQARWAGLSPDAEPLREKQTRFFRREIAPDAAVVSAVISLSPDQVCEVFVNGQSVGTAVRWLPVEPIEVTSAWRPGGNVVGLRVTQEDGGEPMVLGEVAVGLADGSSQVFPIDESWAGARSLREGWTGADAGWASLSTREKAPWDTQLQAINEFTPPPFLRTTFSIDRPVARATAYVTALGLYELHLNGERVGDELFAPGWTEYRKRVHYRAHDVTALLTPGENAAGAILGEGWFAGALSYTGRQRYYGGAPRFLLQLELEFADGTRTTVRSDGGWKASAGPLLYADLLAGCARDARRTLPGWSTAEFDDTGWGAVTAGLGEEHSRDFCLAAPVADPVRRFEEIPARSVRESAQGVYLFDLGQNMAGWARLKIRGRAGQRLVVRHGEMLNASGTLYTSNLRGAMATDVYFLAGGGEETLEPAFTFHGFRYIEITGLDELPEPDAVTGIVVHSQMERTGDFECSNADLNQLFQNIVWGQKGNYLAVPTDCPQRDERLGWTGDTQFFIRTGAFNFEIAAFVEEWLVSLCEDGQKPDGTLPHCAPGVGLTADGGSTAWGDAALLCAHALYRIYGDPRPIDRHWESMQRYMDWLETKSSGGIADVGGFGDWLHQGGSAKTEVIDTAYHAHLCRLMADMAKATDRTEEARHFSRRHEEVKRAFQQAFLQPDGRILESSQTGFALAFTMDLLPEELMEKAAAQFVKDVEEKDWHLGTGFIGTPRLLPALHLAGRDDVAYRVLLQDTFPSWLYQVKLGATTMWEHWNSWIPEKGFAPVQMNSFNHYAFGSVGEYLYRHVAGIDLIEPGFGKILIQPCPGGGLTWARASYESVHGRIASSWRHEDGRLTLEVEIPPGTTARIVMPGCAAEMTGAENGGSSGSEVFEVGSGCYRIISRLKSERDG